jgi:hypothetical protein
VSSSSKQQQQQPTPLLRRQQKRKQQPWFGTSPNTHNSNNNKSRQQQLAQTTTTTYLKVMIDDPKMEGLSTLKVGSLVMVLGSIIINKTVTTIQARLLQHVHPSTDMTVYTKALQAR